LKIHMVRNGESLFSLAEKYNVHPDALLSLNPQINSPEQLVPGIRVKIPIAPSPLEIPPAEYLDEYVVKQGDTLWKLSKAWNVPLKALIAVNPQLRNPNVLLDGEIVYIPKLTAEIHRVEIHKEPVQPFIQPMIPSVEPAVDEAFLHQKQESEQMEDDVHAALHEEVQIQGQGQTHDRYDLSAPHHTEELSYISSVGGANNVDPPEWGDLYTGYMTTAAKPYDKYAVDPRTNIPDYPEQERLSPDEYKPMKPRRQNEAKMPGQQLNKASSKAAQSPKTKAKDGKSKIKNSDTALSVQANQLSTKRASKPSKKRSKPWSKL